MNTYLNPPELYSFGFLVLRIVLGAIFFVHGSQKVLGWFGGHGLKGTSGFLKTALNIPVPLSYLASFTEFLGGIAVAIGVLSRVAALGLAVIMAVAIVRVNWKNGFFMNSGRVGGKGEGYEFDLALLAMSVVLVLTGPGQFVIFN
jgi:putative oxidoreductase